MSLPVIGLGSMVMRLKPNNNPHTGSIALPCLKKEGQICWQTIAILRILFDHQGTVHYEFAPEGQTIQIFIWWF
jgi:hypothetical protein